MDLNAAQEKLESLAGRIKALEDHSAKPVARPKAYVLDFVWPDPGNFVQAAVYDALPEQEQSVTAEAAGLFLMDEIGAVYSVQATLAVGGTAVEYTMHYNKYSQLSTATTTRQYFSFDWQLRDTGMNREWTNAWVPGAVLRTGIQHGWLFGRGRGVLLPGAQLFMRVRAWRSLPLAANAPVTSASVAQHRLQVLFRGYEVAL